VDVVPLYSLELMLAIVEILPSAFLIATRLETAAEVRVGLDEAQRRLKSC